MVVVGSPRNLESNANSDSSNINRISASTKSEPFNGQWKLPWYGGALVGAFAGLVIGVLASGTILMFYRGMRHFQGKHE